MVERIDLTRADDPRDVVHRAVACLAQGGVVGLPTEAAYGLVACALRPEAVARLRVLAAPARAQVANPHGFPTLFLKGADEVADWANVPSEAGRRLARRAWPGPMTLILPVAEQGLARRLTPEVRSFLLTDGTIAVRAPGDPMVREILRLMPGPLVRSIAPAAGTLVGRVPVTADDLAEVEGLDMILDNGPTRLGGPATVVAVTPEGWEIARPGVLSAQALGRMAGTIILFVCTGNTCRSPMAEALCKARLADRLGCRPDELVGRGYVVQSAGVSAHDGMPAAAHAIDVVRSRGGSLDAHASRRATAEMVRQADWIVAMTLDHLDALLDQVPEVADRARLLHPLGDDVADPIGSDRDVYLRTARDIEGYLARLFDDLGF
ncbi:Sua5/YciO/YrdC/YwlC family protein [Tundrisphaera sp. TA3]|uniref:arsenate reductase/protein-tyrosine-phosphatase family protein n=1 Tax=Tundrisphaera sp. TA3 TaxID=3435775 RepID=UPI003EC0F86A